MVFAAIAAGALASGVLVWQASADVVATTSNGPNSWALGSLSLSDDDAGTALFSASGLLPGTTGSNCIALDYSGTVGTAVKLYSGATSDPSDLARFLDLTIEEGSGGGFGSCAGFAPGVTIFSGTLGGFSAASTDYATGVGSWTPSGAGTKVYRFTYTLDPAVPNNRQLTTTQATFVWEAQSS